MVLKCAAAVVAGALIALPAGGFCAETFSQGTGVAPKAPALVPGSIPATPPAGRSMAVPPAKAKPAGGPVGISEPVPLAAEIVGKLLASRASDPDVPLPHPDLSEKSEAPASLTGPTLYGRQEPGGGVLGFRMPIPAERGGSSGNTRYSPASPPFGSPGPSLLQSR